MPVDTPASPVIVIGDRLIKPSSASYTDPGNNQLYSFNASISNSYLGEDKLKGEEISFYLNLGGRDSVPLFRGRITDIEPSATETGIRALDNRTVITGSEAPAVEITDNKNYDGSTLGQFIFSYIDEVVNADSTIIGLSALRDTSPEVYLTGLRSKAKQAYSIILEKLLEANDDTDMEEPLGWFVRMDEDGDSSNITLVKMRSITSDPDMILSYQNGISDISYRIRKPTTIATVYGDKGVSSTFEYGSTPDAFGRNAAKTVDDDTITSNAEAQQRGIREVLSGFIDQNEIEVVATKGHQLKPGHIIYLDISVDSIRGNHRLIGKTITYSQSGGVTLRLKLGRLPSLLRQFI